ncbi:Uu.00g083950.m01.CDS01 [Anthostomella pinea]|uniref:Mechanosensitive ion channel protein n=1 Tax=Anthostomella pinea TaxID=933095 RepID=A0AAI8VLN4_9PEZI|nr:Uu.00g083950.m01.CDS01 [Anthostomella pinea]
MSGTQFQQEYDEKGSSPTLTHAPTVSDHGDVDERPNRPDRPAHLNLPTETERFSTDQRYFSPTESQHQNSRLVDDLTLLKAERAVSNQEGAELRRSHSGVRSGVSAKQDVFNQPQQTPTMALPSEPPNKLNKVFKHIKKLPRMIRYFLYSLPITAILLIPILLGIFVDRDHQAVIGGAGGVQLLWFGIWLEVVWLSLWAARIATSIMPYILSLGAKIMGSGNPKKWKEIGRQLELHMSLFLWLLAVLISFLPIMNTHKVAARVPDEADTAYPYISWINIVNKVIIALFVLAVMNFVEKVVIQWIATSFHMRTYSTRIELNKQSIAYLVHLYEHSKDRLVSEAAVMGGEPGSGAKTPLGLITDNAREMANRVGDVANRVAGDFTGREVRLRNHPRKVVSELLRNTSSAQVLARRLFRTYAQPGSDVLTPHDLNPAFPTPDDAEAAFLVFDRDLNGDVSLEELEAYCDEVHREKKAIAASLKDLDSVITKLDRVFFVIIFIIVVIIFISIISASTAAALASAGTAVLGLSWLLQATAQEFLQSIIFVFVKHPFDVGDRVTVYGNTGTTLTGDDYYVTEISLLYTEFKKMQGHIVQAPNSVLNTLFILNHRRSGQLADIFELTIKYGTPPSVIKELEARMTEFVLENKRDYGSKIITELLGFENACSMTVNFIIFHKTSFQNELLRLTRHNKLAIEMMNHMVSLGIEQPRPQYQISGRDYPIYQANISPPSYDDQQQQQQQQHNVDPALLTATRRRANSRTAERPADQDLFQDVFVSRKISSHQHLPMTHPPRINEEPTVAEASGALNSHNHLERPPTNDSGRRHIFRRVGTMRRSADGGSDRGDPRDIV